MVEEEKPVKVVEKVVEEVDEDSNSKASENGNGTVKEVKENGTSEEKEDDEKEADEEEPAKNGGDTDKGKITNCEMYE